MSDAVDETQVEGEVEAPPRPDYSGRGKKRRPDGEASNRGKHLLSLSLWPHRCFHIRAKKFNGQPAWWAVNAFPALVPETPFSFYWMAREDRDGLRGYIDALLLGHRSKAIEYERSGLVEAIEPFVIDRPDDVRVRISAQRFVDTMLLRDYLDVPLWGRVAFITNGKRLIPNEFVAAMAKMLSHEDRSFIDVGSQWRHATERDLNAMGLKPSDVTSSLYRYQNDHLATAGAQEQAPAVDSAEFEPPPASEDPPTAVTIAATRATSEPPLREIEINRRRFDRHFELLTLVQPPRRAKPYYVRRLGLLRDGRLLWSGTSYYSDGPWTVTQRDTALLLALGISD